MKVWHTWFLQMQITVAVFPSSIPQRSKRFPYFSRNKSWQVWLDDGDKTKVTDFHSEILIVVWPLYICG